MRPRTAARLAWSLWGVTIALTTTGLPFLFQNISVPAPGLFGFRGFTGLFAVAYGTVGALIGARRPGNPIGWLFLAAGLASGSQLLTEEYAIHGVLGHPGSLPGAEVMAWFPSWIWIPVTSLVGVFLFLAPDGRLLSRRWLIPLVGGGIGVAVASAGFALEPGPLENFPAVQNPFGIDGADYLRHVGEGALGVYLAGMAAAAVSLVMRFRRSTGEKRDQLKWIAYAGMIVAVGLIQSLLFATGLLSQAKASEVVTVLSFAVLPLAAGIAILRYRLLDIDVVINRTVVLALLAAFITVVYVGVVVGIGAAVGSESNTFLSIVATAIVAVAIQPARARARRLADRVVYGKRATPYEVLSEFSGRVAGSYSTEDVLPRLARILAEGIGATRSEVWLRVGEGLSLAAAWPPSEEEHRSVAMAEAGTLPAFPAGIRAFAVDHQGELLGALAVEKPPGEPMTPGEERLVANLASQAGLVLRNVRLTEELRARLEELAASRKRLVAAQDAERRRLERNLHDGAQQHLVALALKLRLARDLAERDPAATRAMLEALDHEAGETLENLRDLARGIYPPLLADRGLGEALASQARKAAVPVDVQVDGIGRYPQETEAAVYFCCLEALQNIAKYAAAARATIRVGEEDGFLVFVVEDDGPGFDPATTRRGSGLQNMRDRMEALGGTLEIRSAAGVGTAVRGRVPVATGGGG